jgi:general secretion pathway protein M
MSLQQQFERILQRYPALGALGYGAIIAVLVAMSWFSVAGVLDQRATLAASADILARLQRHGIARPGTPDAAGAPHGSPFIGGQTMTVAGAELLQRVSGAIARVGGRVLSSQVDLHSAQSKPGFISVIVNCELDQPGLQHVLYDLEAGMPFLFVDHLEVQVPDSGPRTNAAPMHVLLAASGQWLAKP